MTITTLTALRDALARVAGYDELTTKPGPDPRLWQTDTVRDAIAVLEGWVASRRSDGIDWHNSITNQDWETLTEDEGYRTHPIPATLDEAAKLPEGFDYTCGSVTRYARIPRVGVGPSEFIAIPRTADECRDRMLLRLLCILAERNIQ